MLERADLLGKRLRLVALALGDTSGAVFSVVAISLFCVVGSSPGSSPGHHPLWKGSVVVAVPGAGARWVLLDTPLR